MSDIVDLGAVDADDPAALASVGGKAANLARLIGAGFGVPEGFCLTTAAYGAGVGNALDDVLAGLERNDEPAELRAAAERARCVVESLELSAELRQDLAEQYRRLGPDVPVAVRSSATAEDLPDASFAGQQDTYLNVIGETALLDAVRRCWASLWTDRAVSYRSANAIDRRAVRLAVVVQRMVPAEIAGVMFTADPVTGHRGHTVIDASPGLGESVVSGSVNPDRFVIDSSSGLVLERRIGDKKTAIRSLPDGGTETVALGTADRACLDDDQLAALTALGRRVQDLYRQPQDTEWAIGPDGSIWLTQARPITTLYPVPVSAQPGTRAFLCLSLAQGLTRPITPMGQSAFRLIATSVTTLAGHPPADRYAGPTGLVMAGDRVFADLTPVLRRRVARRFAKAAAGVMEARTRIVLDRLTDDPRFAPAPARGGIRTVARVLIKARTPVRLAAAAIDPRLAYAGIARIERRLRRGLRVADDATPEQRLDHVVQRLGTDVFLIMPRVFAYAGAGLLSYALCRRLVRGSATPEELQVVLRGLPHNVTTEMDLELWRLTQQIRADGPSRSTIETVDGAAVVDRLRAGTLPAVLQRGMTQFLDRYGHRAVAEIDLGMPRWSDRPEHLINAIANYLRLDDEQAAPEAQFAAGAAAAEKMIVELTARITARSRLRGRLTGWLLRRARALIGLRETPKFFLVLTLAALRSQLQIVGAAAQTAGALDAADDVFWLDVIEARRALAGEDLRARVVERRERYARELRRRHVPRVLLSDGSEPEATGTSASNGDGLSGSPASAGTVTAPARVVLDPVGAHLEPGEILVAPSTDPGWTPLFLTAGGLVMEMGGSNSHGAVVAREYGIPAVVGVPDATTAIRTGELITVDGGAGRVSVAVPD